MNLFDSYVQRVSRPYVGFLRRFGMDFEVSRAYGAVVEDCSGRQYVDCVGGYGNLNIGHNHPHVVEAMVRALQASRPFGWPFISEAHVRLAERLSEVAPAGLDHSLIVNSGAEAVDSALKLARLATGRAEVICCRGAWHGYTLGALSVSEPEMCRSFQPLLPGVHHVPFGDGQAVRDAISPKVGALLVEPIQSESGGILPPEGYLRQLAAMCNSAGVMFILDEIKSGIGKTGRMFACEYEPVEPDVLLVGKSLGGGVMPIGALVAKGKWWTKLGLSFAMTSSSAAGNTLACAAGVAALEVVQSENLCANAETQGRRLQEALTGLASSHPDLVRSVSGRGLLLGLHTASQGVAQEIATACIRRGVLVMPAFLDRTCLLIEPPLCISHTQVDEVIGTLQQACDAINVRSSAHSVEA